MEEEIGEERTGVTEMIYTPSASNPRAATEW